MSKVKKSTFFTFWIIMLACQSQKLNLLPNGLPVTSSMSSKESLSSGSSKSSQEISSEKGQVIINGEVVTHKKTTLFTSGNELQVLPTYFSQILKTIGNQELKMKLVFSETGRDDSTNEITKNFVLEIENADGTTSYIGGIEYPMRDQNKIPSFIQAEKLSKVIGFLNLNKNEISNASNNIQEFNGFERGEASGSMCSQCGGRSEMIFEDEEIKKFSIQLEFLNVRMNQLLKKLKTGSSGEQKKNLG